MGASYYPGAANTALHTDLCSPLATDPTWSGLPHLDRRRLIRPGASLWHALVSHLRPQIILLSVAARYLDAIEFPRVGSPTTLYTVRRTNPYFVTHTVLRLPDDHCTQLMFGRATMTPFGPISNLHKHELGQTIPRAIPLE